MARVPSQNISLNTVVETAIGVAATSGWANVEFNAPLRSFGNRVSKVSRAPVSRERQLLKGAVVDIDSGIEFDCDLTRSMWRLFDQDLMMSTAVNRIVTELAATAAETTGDSYTISALSAAQAEKFEVGTLIWVSGFSTAANNGLKVLDTDASASDTALAVAENLVDESGATALISFAGYEIADTDSPTWTWDGTAKRATLAGVSGLGTLLTQLGLMPEQLVHIGSIASLGGAVQAAFQNSVANDMFGYCTVYSIAANTIVFENVAAELQFTDGTAPSTAVHICFGEFLRNVATNHADFLERTRQMELEYPDLGGVGTDEYEYAKGNGLNACSISIPLGDKATVSYGFIGTKTDNPTTTRKTGASSAAAPNFVNLHSTASHVARLRITAENDDGLGTDFKGLEITITNNYSGEKVVGKTGAKFLNFGNFGVQLSSAEVLFTDGDVINAINDNETLALDWILRSDDGVIGCTMSAMTLTNGERNFPVGESVRLNLSGEAHKGATHGTSIAFSTIPIPFATNEVDV